MTRVLHWCPECDVPLLDEVCGKCKSSAHKVKLHPRADPRLAFNGDLEVIRGAVTNEYGGGIDGAVIRKEHQTVLVNLNYLDQAYEVIQDGAAVGRAFFDLYTLSWRFKPMAEGCLRLWEGAGIGAVVHEDALREGEVLSEGRYHMSFASRPGAFVPLVKHNNQVSGLGVLLDEGMLVARLWGSVIGTEGRCSSIGDVLGANELVLYRAESRACKFLAQLDARLRRPVVLSYSGGKDSLAVLLLTLKSGIEPTLLFNDTGLELPETVENVNRVSSDLGLNLLVADAGRSFWEYFDSFGPPSRDYRWCCKVCKLIPTSKAISRRGDVLSLVGQRRLESSARSRSPDVWRNQWIKSALVASPINDWTMLQVWLYIAMSGKTGLVNELYFKGFDRIGCYMCPACRVAEFEAVKRLHPNLWEGWEGALRRWASARSAPSGWLIYHLWRWVKLPKKVAGFAEELGVSRGVLEATSNRASFKALMVKHDANTVIVKSSPPAPLDMLSGIAPSVGDVHVSGDRAAIEAEGFRAQVSREGYVRIELLGAEVEPVLKKVTNLLARSTLCKGCGSCASWCPAGAISMFSDKPVVDGQLCMRCAYGRCVERCPITSFCAPVVPRGTAFDSRGSCPGA